MIQHHNGLAYLKQLRAFGNAGFIYIHHHQHSITACRLQRLLALQKHVLLILLTVLEHFNQGLYGSRNFINDNLGPAIQRLGYAVNTDCRTKAVHIPDLVPHNQNPVLAGNDFPEGMSLNTGLNTGVLLHLLALSAIIADLLRRLDHTLVAAAAQARSIAVLENS